MGALSDLRWLAGEVLPAVPEGIPDPLLVSRSLTPAVRDHLGWWIRNPDPAGRFAAKTRWLRRLPAALSRRILFALDYDGFVYVKDSAVIANFFFQRRGDALNGFAIAVSDGREFRGYSAVIVLDFVAYASRCRGVVKARIGTGRTPVSRRALARLTAKSESLGWRVDPDGWITFR